MRKNRPSPKGKGWKFCTFKERFEASYAIDIKTKCWNWHKTGTNLYGGINYKGKRMLAHRAAWLHFKGKIPKGLKVLHTCDNKACVNYREHLYLGTQKQNYHDFMNRHPRAKEILAECGRIGAKALHNFRDKMSLKQRREYFKKVSKLGIEGKMKRNRNYDSAKS